MSKTTKQNRIAAAAGVMAVALSVAAPLSAVAAETPTGKGTSTTGSIEITQAISHPAKAYQVLDGDVETDGSIADIVWGAGIQAEQQLLADLKRADDAFRDCTTAKEVAQVLNVIRYDATTNKWVPNVTSTQTDSDDPNYPGSSQDTRLAKIFANVASKYIKANAGKAFDDTTTPLASNLDDGWYIVCSDYDAQMAEGAALLFPGLITVGKGRSTVTPKESTPSFDKRVQENSNNKWVHYADTETNETVNYKLTFTLGDEDVSYYKKYSVEFIDSLPSAFELDLSSVKVTVKGVDKTSQFTIDLSDENVLDVKSADVLALGAIANSEVVVTYSGKLNSTAVTGGTGNVNSAKVLYECDPRDDSLVPNQPKDPNPTPTIDVTLYTYKMVDTKTDSESNGNLKLAGAKFGVKDPATGKWAILKTSTLATGQMDTATNNNTGFDTVYICGWTTDRADAGLVTSNANGTFTIAGLDSKEYELVETVAPDGYDLDETPIGFVVASNVPTSNGDTAINKLTLDIAPGGVRDGDVATGTVSAQITNVKSPILPTTGLGGILTATILGSGLVGVAGIAAVKAFGSKNEDAKVSESADDSDSIA